MASHPVDVQAVREQLRLLGHSVPDDVIASFIDGLRGSGDGAVGPGELGRERGRRWSRDTKPLPRA